MSLLSPSQSSSNANSPFRVVVIKVGSSTVCEDGALSLRRMSGITQALLALKLRGFSPVLVTSGAVALGCLRLGRARPGKGELAVKQALASVGQSRLMRAWEDLLGAAGMVAGQVLLGRADIGDKTRYLNADRTLTELLRLGCVPVINENDTVAVEGLKVGDNDTLSALVATMVRADLLVLLTDVDSLFTKDPKLPGAEPVHLVESIESLAVDTSGGQGGWGTGGMATKLTAAQIATAAGTRTAILNGERPGIIVDLAEGSPEVVGKVGTVFLATPRRPTTSSKRWVVAVQPMGELHLDAGAVKAVRASKSLFAPGITKVQGSFGEEAAVKLIDANSGLEVARAISNYSAEDISALIACPARPLDIQALLGDKFTSEEISFRSNIVVMV
jgi:glutamate 5-kinase